MEAGNTGAPSGAFVFTCYLSTAPPRAVGSSPPAARRFHRSERLFVSASTSRTLPAEIAESESVMALIERGKAEGQIAGDDVRRAFEADQIPPTQWKNVLRSLNQILDEEGVTLMVSAAEAPKRTRKSVAAKTQPKRIATKTVAVKTTQAKKAAPASAAPAAPAAPTASATGAAPGQEPAGEEASPKPTKKTAAKKAAAKKTASKKTAAPKKTAAKKSVVDELLQGDEELAEDIAAKSAGKPGSEEAPAAEVKNENEGFVISDDDEDDGRPSRSPLRAATADPVKDYLKQIGKVPLSTRSRRSSSPSALRPVSSPRTSWLPRRSSPPSSSGSWRSSPRTAAAPRTTCWRPTSASWSRWPSATRAAACSSWT